MSASIETCKVCIKSKYSFHMDGLGLQLLSVLGSMKPGLTFISKSGPINIENRQVLSIPTSSFRSLELSIAFVCGYCPIVLGSEGAVEIRIGNDQANSTPWMAPVMSIYMANNENSVTVSCSGAQSSSWCNVTLFVFGVR